MAEKLACLGKKGGKLKETVLWTNPSPTSDFGDQTVTLSKGISNYDYIKVIFKPTKSGNTYFDIMMPVESFVLTNVSSANSRAFAAYFRDSSDYPYARPVGYVSNTSVRIRYANRLNATGYSEAILIPYQIIGLK